MKTCSVCSEEKELSEFTLKRGKQNAACKICTRARTKAHYSQKKEYYKDKRRRQQQEGSEWLKEYKAKLVCCNCDEDEPCCLDFHHMDESEKDGNISHLARYYGRKRLEKELKKCLVVCSNCHRKHHTGVIDLHALVAQLD